jgi:predicted aspartyl protease
MDNRTIEGLVDEFGYPYLIVNIIDPITRYTLTGLKAIIDTGAAYTHVKRQLVEILKLTPIDKTTIKHLTDGNIVSDIFIINLKFGKIIEVPDIKARILTQPDYPSDLIIGLDIIKFCDFSYNSKSKSFNFVLFPDVLSEN